MAAETQKINPRFIQTGFWDFSDDERYAIARALDAIPGSTPDLWRKFQRNDCVALVMRDEAGALAVVSFYELRREKSGALEFFVRGGFALQPTAHATEDGLPQYEAFARFFKCGSISFATQRAGLVRKVEKMPGWELAAVLEEGAFVMRKNLEVSE